MGDNIRLGPGKLYINGELFAGIKDATIEEETPETYAEDTHGIVRAYNPAEFSISVELTEESAREVIRMTRELSRYCVRIYHDCPNRRVAHLAIYGKKQKTRKKNIKRLFKYAEMGAKT